ncbi:MAG: FHA domain-containing protein [Pyrinomonadaceae bacterium]|nr:FHA domain-containing protein [Pyrinomonadaceae bacterium]
MALLHISDAKGRQWQYRLSAQTACTIGRAPDNCIVLDDMRASRHHAHIRHNEGTFILVDGVATSGGVQRSANRVFVNGAASFEHVLTDGDRVTIGMSTLRYEAQQPIEPEPEVRYDNKRLGHTQLLVSANDVIRAALQAKPTTATAATTSAHNANEELESLRRKADILSLLYEMSRTLSADFDLKDIFDKATDIIFRVTPADRVVALLTEAGAANDDEDNLRPVSMRVKNEQLEAHAKKSTIGRTITKKVIRDRVALLSQDAAADEMLRSESIVSQGVRSTMCAPLVAESGVHGALYADCLDPFAVFTKDHLELLSAIAAQTAVAVESARSHERLAREEVARANYSRFLPEYVVRQMLEHPESFKLGGVNQTITVLFADIRGFTRLSEHAPPEQVVQLLNRYFSAMTEVIFAHGGTLDKYIGDGLMALFGAPTASPEDASNAVAAAVEMQRQMSTINEELREAELHEISIGIGLHTGEATVGYIGSERRSEYTAIGDTVNLSARLESNAQGGQILMSEATKSAAQSPFPFRPRDPITVKNRVQPVPLFEVEWQQAREMVNAER